MRSLTAGIPNGRSLPPSLGISTRLIGSGRYSPVLSARSSSSKYASARTSNRLTLCPSTPAAPALPLTLSQATLRVWLRYTLSIRLNHFPPLTPFSSAANMRSLHTVASTHVQSRPCLSAPCVALWGTADAWLSPPLWNSRFHLPASRPSAQLCFLRFSRLSPLRYHEGSDSCAVHHPQRRSPRLPHHIFLSFRLQPRWAAWTSLLPPRQRVQRVSDFAMNEQARRSTPAESSSFTYGPTFRLQLLPTPLRADAVTFGYGAVAYSGTDFHRADVAPSRAHSLPHEAGIQP